MYLPDGTIEDGFVTLTFNHTFERIDTILLLMDELEQEGVRLIACEVC